MTTITYITRTKGEAFELSYDSSEREVLTLLVPTSAALLRLLRDAQVYSAGFIGDLLQPSDPQRVLDMARKLPHDNGGPVMVELHAARLSAAVAKLKSQAGA